MSEPKAEPQTPPKVSTVPPDARDPDIDNGVLNLWVPGTRLTLDCSLDAIERSLEAAKALWIEQVVIKRTEQDIVCRFRAHPYFADAQVTFQAIGGQTVVSLLAGLLCRPDWPDWPGGQEIHKHLSGVISWALQEHETTRSRHPDEVKRDDDIRRLWVAGRCDREIGAMVGLTEQAVRKRRQRMKPPLKRARKGTG